MSKLTNREVQVVQLLSEGLTIEQIADQIGVKYSYAKFMAHSIRDKTGMDTTTAAVAWCLRNRFID